MGLELRAYKPGIGEFERLPVGGYSYVHVLRAALAAAFTARLWQIGGGAENDLASYVLTWISRDGQQIFPDADEVEYDEMAVAAALKSLGTERFGIAYGHEPEDVWMEVAGKLREGALDENIPQAFAGLVKVIFHSDADGWLSPGDAVDVLACLAFIGDSGGLVLPPDEIEGLQQHTQFFERVVEAGAWVEFL